MATLEIRCPNCGSFLARVDTLDFTPGTNVTLAIQVNCCNRKCAESIFGHPRKHVEYVRVRPKVQKKILNVDGLPYM